jgi:glyoxylase-like metal-dependent hydrolase (beta-lactamase superfamily II)
VTWSPARKAPSGQSYKIVGYLNGANIVERVEAWVEHQILGDMHVEFRYSEYRDFGGLKVVVLEGGQSEARGLAILAETKRLFSNKRIRYVVNSHPHFDHAGGLAPFAGEGITILTDDNNKYFLENALGTNRPSPGTRSSVDQAEGLISTFHAFSLPSS